MTQACRLDAKASTSLTTQERDDVLKLAVETNAVKILPLNFRTNPESMLGIAPIECAAKIHFISYLDHPEYGKVLASYAAGAIYDSADDGHTILDLQSLVVHEKFQRKGVGTFVVNSMKKIAQEIKLEAYDDTIMQYWKKQDFEPLPACGVVHRGLFWYDKTKMDEQFTCKQLILRNLKK